MLFNRLLCLVFRPFFPVGVAERLYFVSSVPLSSQIVSLRCSLQLDHVQVVERHQMSITAENVHVALRINDRNMAVTGRGLCASDQTEFVFVVMCSIMVVGATELLSFLHLLMIQVEALVGILNDERVHHGHRCR